MRLLGKDARDALGGAIGPETAIVPLVNGIPFWFEGAAPYEAQIVGAVVFTTATVLADGSTKVQGRERLILGAIAERNYPLLQATILVVTCGFVVVNFVVDLLYAAIDPRVRA